MFARGDGFAQMIYMWCTQGILHAHFLIINPQSCFPMASLQKKFHIFFIPVSRNIYFFLVPCHTCVSLQWLQPKRNFYLPGLTVFSIFRFFEPVIIPYSGCPV